MDRPILKLKTNPNNDTFLTSVFINNNKCMLQNSPKLARGVDVAMVRANRIYILMVRENNNKLFQFFSRGVLCLKK